jgi:hypothetical protein
MNKKFFVNIVGLIMIGLLGGAILTACQKSGDLAKGVAAPEKADLKEEKTEPVIINSPELQKTEAMIKQILVSVFGQVQLTNYFSSESGAAPTGGSSLEYSLSRGAVAADAEKIIKLFNQKGFTTVGQEQEDEVISWVVEDSSAVISGSSGIGDQTMLIIIAPQADEEEME